MKLTVEVSFRKSHRQSQRTSPLDCEQRSSFIALSARCILMRSAAYKMQQSNTSPVAVLIRSTIRFHALYMQCSPFCCLGTLKKKFAFLRVLARGLRCSNRTILYANAGKCTSIALSCHL